MQVIPELINVQKGSPAVLTLFEHARKGLFQQISAPTENFLIVI
jgi:hypothetical protein